MAHYTHLKVFSDFYKLSLEILNILRSFPRLFKFTLGQELQKNIYQILSLLVLANSSFERKNILAKTIVQVELLQIQIRLAKDAQCFTNIQVYLNTSTQLTEVLKQLEGWKKSSK